MHSFHSIAKPHHKEPGPDPANETRGLVLNWGWRYDLLVWALDTLVLRGKLKKLQQQALEVARLQKGEAVLDVGCGTGTLALAARERVGDTGRVCGIDPAPRQLARARAKAARYHLPVDFQSGVIEQLPFPGGSFDAVFSTWMMHHLPDDLKRQGIAEIVRVLKPQGRLVIVDLQRPEENKNNSRMMGAGVNGLQDLPPLLLEAGIEQVESGDLPFTRLMGLSTAGFILARKSATPGKD